MSKFIDLTGQKFVRLTIIQRVANNKWKNICWLCQCDCGQSKIITNSDLKSGKTQSCGCLRREKTIERSTKHNHSTITKTTKTYYSWANIIQRCTNPKNKSYDDYGGRGITVCKRWLKFSNFLQDMGECPLGCTIDRINNNKGYCKENCRWTTKKQQMRNKRDNLWITHEGETQLLIIWAQKFNINYTTLWQRLYRYNWSMNKSLETPVKNTRRRKNGCNNRKTNNK